MSWWLVGSVGNALVALSYLAISVAILGPLIRSGQARRNHLGMATGAIFFTCAVGHGFHGLHPWLGNLGVAPSEGLAARVGVEWHDALWDLATAGVGIYYWTLRRTYGHIIRGPVMFDDQVERQRILELEAAHALDAVRAAGAAELARSEERFRLAFEHAPIGVALISLQPSSLGKIVRANEAFYAMLGQTAEHLAEVGIIDLTVVEDQPTAARRLAQMAGGALASYSEPRRYVHGDGHVVWASVSSAVVPDADGRPLWAVAQFEDITARRDAELLLARQALHDALTGLPNRALLMDRLEHALSRAHRQNSRVAVFFIDLDRFKYVNDTLGHDAGDHLLVEVARRLCQAGREDDTVGRLGGDEFVVLCEDVTDQLVTERLAQHLLTAINAPYEVAGEVLVVTASLGIAVSAPGDTPGELLRDADTAMYRAKDSGRARFSVYDKELRDKLHHRLRTENELRYGIEHDQLRIVVQPVVDLASGEMAKVEALVRWAHPTRGLLTPGEFCGIAEESGLIVPLDNWMLREGCRQLAKWQRDRPVTAPQAIAINLTAADISRPGIVDTVVEALESAGLPASALCLEITETVLLDANTAPTATLVQLKQLGVSIALDDFGTGYSSLTYLKRFPVDIVKIDRSFVSGLGVNPEDTAIVQAVVGLSRALGLITIAEGVEEARQQEKLREFGCQYGQGFLYHPPVPVAELVEQGRVMSLLR